MLRKEAQNEKISKKKDCLSVTNNKLTAANTRSKERIIKRNELITMIDKEKANLQFQLYLSLT